MKDNILRRRKIMTYIFVIITILFLYVIIFKIPWFSMFNRFNTPEEAVAAAKKIDVSDVIKTIEYNDVAFVIYKTSDAQSQYDFVAKDDKGWIPRLDSQIPTFGRHYSNGIFDREDACLIYCNSFYDKFVVQVNGGIKLYSENDVSDNLGSEFMYYVDTTFPSMTDQIWFTVLDEKPEQYSIKVGDEVTEIIK